MDVESTILHWAKQHPEIVSVSLGGSRAKGTHLPNSDYDFSISLDTEPSLALVERLTDDLRLENPQRPFIFGQFDRHFLLIGRYYKPESMPTIVIAFSNLKQFETALEQHVNYPLIEEQFEFMKSSIVMYDPYKRLATLRNLEYPGWVRKHVMRDAMNVAAWNLEKYEKAQANGYVFVAQMMKMECLWLLVKAVAAFHHVHVGSRYDYETVKKNILSLKDAFIHEEFFKAVEQCASHNEATLLKSLFTEIDNLVKISGG